MRTTSPDAHLVGDERGVGVRDTRIDLDAAVHRARVHHDLPLSHARRRDPVQRRVLAERRHERLVPFARAASAGRRRRRHPRSCRCRTRPRSRAPRCPAARASAGRPPTSARPTSASACTRERATRECSTSPTMATCRPSSLSERLAHRVEVEERLRRVLMLSVARVHDVRVGEPRHELRRADRRMAHDDDVRLVRRERERRVLQRLALVYRRARGAEGHRVRRQALRRELEAGKRPRGRLVEEVHDRAAAERRQLLDLAIERRRERLRGVEHALDVTSLEVADREQMTPQGAQAVGAQAWPSSSGSPTRYTPSRSSISTSSTWMRSPRPVGRFLPT